MALFDKNKKKKLTPREAKFFDILAKNPTMPISEAGRQAGYSENTVASTIYRKLGKARNNFQIALEKAGLTDEYIAKRLHEGTNAFVTKVHQEKHGNNKFGNERYEYHKENQVDFKSRKEYLELIAKIRGDFNPEDEGLNKTNISIKSVIINNDIDINQAIQIYQDTLNNLDNE